MPVEEVAAATLKVWQRHLLSLIPMQLSLRSHAGQKSRPRLQLRPPGSVVKYDLNLIMQQMANNAND